MTTKSAFQCAFDERASPIRADFKEERLDVVTYSGKIGFDRFGVDMGALKCNIITKCFRCGVNGHAMKFAVRHKFVVEVYAPPVESSIAILRRIEHSEIK